MGNCMSSEGDAPTFPVQRPSYYDADPSSMEEEQLLRVGIAEAQVATVSRHKRDREAHLHRARGFLLEALRRCEAANPDLRMHLLAVLFKLGVSNAVVHEAEQAGRSLTPQGSHSRNFNNFHDSEEQTPTSSTRQSGKSPMAHSDGREASGRATPSEHSSEEDAVNPQAYHEMQEHLLLEDSETEEPLTSPAAANVSARLDSPPGEHIDRPLDKPGEVWDTSLLISRNTCLSSVQEGDDGASSSGESSPRNQVGGWESSPRCSLAKSGDMQPEDSSGSMSVTGDSSKSFQGSASQGSGNNIVSSQLSSVLLKLEQHLDKSSERGDSPRRPLSPQREKLRKTFSHTRTSSWPAALGSPSPAIGSFDTPNSVGEWKESLQQRRSLHSQPQQTPNALNVKRRQHRSLGSVLDGGVGIDGMERNFSPFVSSRHSRRQPSQQSSSSGSQGAVSDSDSSATKRAVFTFAGPIEEQKKEEAWRLSGKWPSKSSLKFEPPSRNRLHEEEQGDLHVSRGSPGSSVHGASGEECSPGPSSESRTPPQGTPVRENMETFGFARELEKATANESDIKNPLSQLDLFPQGSPLVSSSRASSVNASPCAMSARSSVASWAPITSPCFEGAVSGPGSPLGSFAFPSPSDKVSVRILNGITGEEEVRFPIPVEASYSEHHFYQMLDRLCQKHAAQALSDLNWLQQADGGGRFQRRKCDLGMVEELFSQEQPPHHKGGPLVLLLCTVPAKPPSEMPANKVRLKNLDPSRVCYGEKVVPVQMLLETSLLEAGHKYSVAFTHQWSHVTYTAEASALSNRKGVELCVPWQMLTASGSSSDGLYDVHLVTDGSYRSENRRTLTVGSAESEFSSSSTAMSAAQSSFVPLSGMGKPHRSILS